MSFFAYVRNEITRSYMLDHDQERYTSKREKMYTFMRIPRKPRNSKKMKIKNGSSEQTNQLLDRGCPTYYKT